MTVEVVIPWRSTGCPYRERSLEFLYKFYLDYFGNVSLSDSDQSKEFNRAQARNLGVSKSSAEIVVVTDSDLYVPIDQINEAIDLAKAVNNQVRPFSSFGHMNRKSTEYFLNLREYPPITKTSFETLSAEWPGLHGGTFVINRDLWISLGGMDEKFSGWGGEDNAFNIRCQNRLGVSAEIVDGYAFHLFHPYHRRMSKNNANLLNSYKNGWRQ